jgi:hypothetical protein
MPISSSWDFITLMKHTCIIYYQLMSVLEQFMHVSGHPYQLDRTDLTSILLKRQFTLVSEKVTS